MWYKINNNWSVSFLFFFLCVIVISSCEKKDIPKGVPHHIKKLETSIKEIEDVYSYYKGKPVPLKLDTGFKEIIISGTVISDPASGNNPKGYIMIQDDNSGIALDLSDVSSDIPLGPGDLVKVNVLNGKLTKKDGNFVITDIRPSDITKYGSNKADPIPVTLEDLNNNFDVYNNRLIKVKLAEIVPKPEAGETYKGHKNLSDPTVESSEINLYTFPSSKLASVDADANATFVGIAMYGKNKEGNSLEKQIWLRDTGDIQGNNIISVNAPIVITGFIANTNGADGPEKGDVSQGITHKGGYEYMQFMALEDIDFSKTPYSVVTCNNGGAQPDGWATGGKWTFKFDLTQGTAKAGTFFYVGGPSKVIDGYWGSHGGLSTDISGANWIRTIAYHNGPDSKVVGDGFGNSTNALLGNGGSADGFAVFKGTDVTPTSVPVDAVFFNAPVGYALTNGNGYLIPNNDFYSQVDPATGDPQSLFGQGTNTFAVGGKTGKSTYFTALGGLVYKKGWIVPRTPTFIKLLWDAQLSDIESGENITKFIH